jgi:hypothetical protein
MMSARLSHPHQENRDMPKARLRRVWGLATALCGFATALPAQVNTFQVTIPKKTAAGQLPISRVKMTITLTGEGPVAFNVTNPAAVTMRLPASGTVTTGSDPVEQTYPLAPPSVNTDIARLESPSIGADAPKRRRYVIWLDLSGDFNAGSSCSATYQAGAEQWTVAIAAGTPQIAGACLESFDLNTTGAECLLERSVPLSEPLAAVSGFAQACLTGSKRPPVDAILVLDHSGSMGGTTTGGGGPQKIQALRTAVTSFIDAWTSVRSTESAPPDDKLGLVFFDHNAKWQKDLGVVPWAGFADGVHPFTTIGPAIKSNIAQVNPSGATSVGDGLLLAANAFGVNPLRRQVVLLMSNGWENSDARVKVDNPAAPTQVLTYSTANPGATTPLPNAGNYQIYSVTVGAGTQVSADINEDIATATKGFYTNTETNATDLNLFFQELLQNFVRFNTWETARLVSGSLAGGPFTTQIPLSSTTVALVVRATSAGNFLQLTATPPGGGAPIVGTGVGSAQVALRLPPPGGTLDPRNPWNIRLEAPRLVGVDSASLAGGRARFELIAMTDDNALSAGFTILDKDYAPGDRIRLRATLGFGGKRVTGVGSAAGDRIVAEILKPGQSVGDVLSASGAPTTQPTPGDPTTDANAMLQNLLQSNPNALAQAPDQVILFDDGDPAHDDSTANDGIYSGALTVAKAGHHTFVFGAQGGLDRGARFSRQQIISVHVRDVPSGANTTMSTSVSGQTLTVLFTPRNISNNLMGPGWANYFWLTGPGLTPFRPVDNLNGSYTATTTFTGGSAPAITLHFLRVSQSIDSTDTPSGLGIPLDSTNAVPVEAAGGGFVFKWWWLLLILLVIILIVMLVRRSGGGGP